MAQWRRVDHYEYIDQRVFRSTVHSFNNPRHLKSRQKPSLKLREQTPAHVSGSLAGYRWDNNPYGIWVKLVRWFGLEQNRHSLLDSLEGNMGLIIPVTRYQ